MGVSHKSLPPSLSDVPLLGAEKGRIYKVSLPI